MNRFPTTQWSLIYEAKSQDQTVSSSALSDFFLKYQAPIFEYLRSWTKSTEDAEDLKQEFFSKLVAADFFSKFDRQKCAKFRSFLKTCLRNFIHDHYARQSAKKRGGDVNTDSLTQHANGAVASLDVIDERAHRAEQIFDRTWIEEIVDEVLMKMRTSSTDPIYFDAILNSIIAPATNDTSDNIVESIANQFEKSRDAVAMQRSRFLGSLRNELRLAVRQTVDCQDNCNAELRDLKELLTWLQPDPIGRAENEKI